MSESQIFVNAVRDSSTETLIKAIRIIVDGMQSKDGLPNAVIQEAAERLEKQNKRIKQLEKQNKRIKQLEQELSECNAHRKRLIESSMEAWGRIDEQETSQ